MKNKKGAGAIIGWVLLMGFAIGLATTVFIWMTGQTEEMGESATRFVECGMDCDNVMINVVVADPVDCGGKTCCLKITNTRYLNIEKIILRALELVESDDTCGPLEVKQTPVPIFCGQNWAPQNVSVMPIIKVKKELCACKNKAIAIEC